MLPRAVLSANEGSFVRRSNEPYILPITLSSPYGYKCFRPLGHQAETTAEEGLAAKECLTYFIENFQGNNTYDSQTEDPNNK
jgi:hypothetical protein